MAKLTEIKDRKPNKDTIDMLEKALAQAKSGELRTIVLLKGWDDDKFSDHWVLDNRSSRYKMLGAFSYLHHELLTNTGLEFGDSILANSL